MRPAIEFQKSEIGSLLPHLELFPISMEQGVHSRTGLFMKTSYSEITAMDTEKSLAVLSSIHSGVVQQQ